VSGVARFRRCPRGVGLRVKPGNCIRTFDYDYLYILRKSLVISHCTRQGSNLQPCDPMQELDVTIGRPSAIHSNNLPSNVRGKIGDEENGHLGDLLKRTKTTLRRASLFEQKYAASITA